MLLNQDGNSERVAHAQRKRFLLWEKKNEHKFLLFFRRKLYFSSLNLRKLLISKVQVRFEEEENFFAI